jgi:hypothetical protein
LKDGKHRTRLRFQEIVALTGPRSSCTLLTGWSTHREAMGGVSMMGKGKDQRVVKNRYGSLMQAGASICTVSVQSFLSS